MGRTPSHLSKVNDYTELNASQIVHDNNVCLVPNPKGVTFGDWTMMSAVIFVKTATR